jgi:hypothetical protein
MKRIILILIICSSCKKNNTTAPFITCDPTISYSNKVKLIFATNCTASGCHDGVNLPSLADYITAKDASVQIRDAVARGIMPKYSVLSSADKAALLCWIDSGTKNN